MASPSKCRRRGAGTRSDGTVRRRRNPSTYGLFAYFLLTAGESNPICDVRATIGDDVQCAVLWSRKISDGAFFLPNLLRFRRVSLRSRAVRRSRVCRSFHASVVRVLGDAVQQQSNRKSSHLPPLWLSRQPSFRCVVRHCQDFEVTSSASWHRQVSAAISLRVGPSAHSTPLAGRLVGDDLRRVNERQHRTDESPRSAISGLEIWYGGVASRWHRHFQQKSICKKSLSLSCSRVNSLVHLLATSLKQFSVFLLRRSPGAK